MDEIEVYEANPLAAHEQAAARDAVARGPAPSPPQQTVPLGCLRALLTAPKTELQLSVGPAANAHQHPAGQQTRRATVQNRGNVPALFIHLDTNCAESGRCHVVDSYFTLLPGEKREVDVHRFDRTPATDATGPLRLRAQAWNSPEVSQEL